jgi:hypothetical protein
MNPLLILRNETENWNRDRIFNTYQQAFFFVDMILVVGNNNTFVVLKNRWGKQCTLYGFEVTLPMSKFVDFVTNPETEGSKLV